MVNRFLLNEAEEHLCTTCRYLTKCARALSINQSLIKLSMDAFENWLIDVDILYKIKDCPRYVENSCIEFYDEENE